jgi:hypothetical protein
MGCLAHDLGGRFDPRFASPALSPAGAKRNIRRAMADVMLLACDHCSIRCNMPQIHMVPPDRYASTFSWPFASFRVDSEGSV